MQGITLYFTDFHINVQSIAVLANLEQWCSQGSRDQGAKPPNPGKNMHRVMGKGGPITGCLIHRIAQYIGYKDACVRLTFPVLPFRKDIGHIQIGFTQKCSTSVAGCSPRGDKASKIS